MGHRHRLETDLETLEAAASTVWELVRAYVFPGDVEFLKEFPEQTLTAPSFRIAFRLQQDVIDPAGDRAHTMVVLRFTQLSGAPDPGWALYVRGDWPDRTDRFPSVGPLRASQLRKAFSPKKQPPGTENRFALTNDDIYLMEGMPPQDLTSQLCLFVLQTELSSQPGVMDWLTQYVVRNFRRAKQTPPEELARDVVLRLIQYKWWMEDARAWRRYVAMHRIAVERQYRVQSGELPEDPSDGTTEDKLIEAIEGRPNPNDDPHRGEAHENAPSRTLDRTKELFSVEEASQHLGVSLATVYSHIHKRRLAVQNSAGRFMIPRSELIRLTVTPRLPEVIAAVARRRGCRLASARRHVLRLRRRGLTLEEILRDLARA